MDTDLVTTHGLGLMLQKVFHCSDSDPPLPISEKLGIKMPSVKRLELTVAPEDPDPTLTAVLIPLFQHPAAGLHDH